MQQFKRHFSTVYGALYFFTELCEIKSNIWTEIERFKSEKITHRLHGQKRKKQQLHEIREHRKKRKKFFSILSLTSYYCSNLSFEGNCDVQSMCVCDCQIFFSRCLTFFFTFCWIFEGWVGVRTDRNTILDICIMLYFGKNGRGTVCFMDLAKLNLLMVVRF